MAAIDKLYLKDYVDYDYLRRWALVYYPKLLLYFYDTTFNYKEWCKITKNEKYGYPVMNTPFKVDKKLKWICPLHFIREYLHEQCGVNPKLEWFYKLFWKDKSLWK